ncbi:hypothetical protein ACFQWA_20500 [Streptomyces thermogriseus]|uniref:Uncharacterized protein n=1 Tax=Streptomyces thermogriseus TaxID=75292 RepID=A0ABP4DFA0_9ACTN
MSGRADSDTHPEISEADDVQAAAVRAVRDDADAPGKHTGKYTEDAAGNDAGAVAGTGTEAGDTDDTDDAEAVDTADDAGSAGRAESADGTEDTDDPDGPDDVEDEDLAQVARRARWTATGSGALLTFAGLAAALLRLARPAPALVPAAYATGAGVCAVAAFLGSRGRTRRALWLMIAGLMVMALGDQFD